MKLVPIVAIASLMAATAGPLAAQQAGADYDPQAQATLEGVTETVLWSMTEGKLWLKPSAGSEVWEIALPNSRTLLDRGISAEVLARGAPVKVRVYKAKDTACKPYCKAQAVEITLDRQGKTVALFGANPAG